MALTTQQIKERLEYLRGELRAERISYGELAELQGLAPHIDPSDTELLEAAGVPEHVPAILVEVEGGVVTGVFSSHKITVRLQDHDVDASESDIPLLTEEEIKREYPWEVL